MGVQNTYGPATGEKGVEMIRVGSRFDRPERLTVEGWRIILLAPLEVKRQLLTGLAGLLLGSRGAGTLHDFNGDGWKDTHRSASFLRGRFAFLLFGRKLPEGLDNQVVRETTLHGILISL